MVQHEIDACSSVGNPCWTIYVVVNNSKIWAPLQDCCPSWMPWLESWSWSLSGSRMLSRFALSYWHPWQLSLRCTTNQVTHFRQAKLASRLTKKGTQNCSVRLTLLPALPTQTRACAALFFYT